MEHARSAIEKVVDVSVAVVEEVVDNAEKTAEAAARFADGVVDAVVDETLQEAVDFTKDVVGIGVAHTQAVVDYVEEVQDFALNTVDVLMETTTELVGQSLEYAESYVEVVSEAVVDSAADVATEVINVGINIGTDAAKAAQEALLEKAALVIQTLQTFNETLNTLSDPRLAEALLMNYLEANEQVTYEMLKIMGLIGDVLEEGLAEGEDPDQITTSMAQAEGSTLAGPPGTSIDYPSSRPARYFRWSMFPLVFGSSDVAPGEPTGISAPLQKTYGWNSSTFKSDLLFGRIEVAAKAKGFPAHWHTPTSEEDGDVFPSNTPQLRIPFTNLDHDHLSPLPVDADVDVGIAFTLLPPTTAGGVDAGIGVLIYGTATLSSGYTLNKDPWILTFVGEVSSSETVGFTFRPLAPPDLSFSSTHPSEPSIQGAWSISLKYDAGTPIELFKIGGEPEDDIQFSVTLDTFELIYATALDTTKSDPEERTEVIVEAKLDDLHFAIVPGPAADSFIGKALPPDGIQANFDIDLRYSTLTGFTIGGSASASGSICFEIPIKKDICLGPVELKDMMITICGEIAEEPRIIFRITSDIEVTLGDFFWATVEGIGFEAVITFESGGAGLIGPVTPSWNYVPPTGAGAVINIEGVLIGGGRISFDKEEGLYSGAIQLRILDSIDISGVGIIATKFPDGSEGYSALVSISVIFPAGLQLGFGFTLTGVGGIVGINRTFDIDELRTSLSDGALDSIMFPDDVVANLDIVVDDLSSVFPVAEGQHVFGPFFRIGWGTPTLLTLDVGLVMEVGGPLVIAVIANLQGALPTEEAPLISIACAAYGVLDLGQGFFEFFGTLAGSEIVGIPIKGEMASKLLFGNTTDFMMSLGGFHPDYDPMPGFESMERMGMSLEYGGWMTFTMEAYLAITTNTFQIGALVDCDIEPTKGTRVYGWLGFDVFIQFKPFCFKAAITAGVSLSVVGYDLLSITLEFALSGPQPWNASGFGQIKVGPVKIKVNFDETWGDTAQVTVDSIDAWGLLQDAYNARSAWNSVLPDLGVSDVTLRSDLIATAATAEEGDGAADPELVPVLIHPLGTITVEQVQIPLDIALDKVGEAAVDAYEKFSLASVAVGSRTLVPGADPTVAVGEATFARGQFQNLTDAEKLSTPAVQPYNSGMTIGPFNDLVAWKDSGAALHYKYDEGRVVPASPPSLLAFDMSKRIGGVLLLESGKVPGAKHKTLTPAAQAVKDTFLATGALPASYKVSRGNTVRVRTFAARSRGKKTTLNKVEGAFTMAEPTYRVVDRDTGEALVDAPVSLTTAMDTVSRSDDLVGSNVTVMPEANFAATPAGGSNPLTILSAPSRLAVW